jgi:hypothetical protein
MQQITNRSDYDFQSNYPNTEVASTDADVSLIIQAAIKIQRVWRRYIDLQVSRYYKDLVIFHNEGDPALIMKYINPIEAKFIDSACGIHIKFRLAGVSTFSFAGFKFINKLKMLNLNKTKFVKVMPAWVGDKSIVNFKKA